MKMRQRKRMVDDRSFFNLQITALLAELEDVAEILRAALEKNMAEPSESEVDMNEIP